MKLPSEFAQLERDGWQRVAAKYEDAWSGLTRLFIADLLDAAGVAAGHRVLDVACGPGYVSEAARARHAESVGIDFSSEMVRLARERNSQIDFRVGDAQALEFGNNEFDALVINFGVLHLPNPETAFAEARRVLRAGGRMAFTVWAAPDVSPGARLIEGAVRAHANMNVSIPKGPDDFSYSEPDQCRTVLARSGFDPASVVFRTVVGKWRVPFAAFIFEAERDAGVRTAALLAAQTPEALAAIRRDIEIGMAAFEEPPGFAVPYAAHVIAAAVP